MTVYTCPERRRQLTFAANSLKDQPSPTLIFQKWQAYDAFEGENKFEHKESRKEYLPNIAKAVHSVYNSTFFQAWHDQYTSAQSDMGSIKISFTTVWRLLVGYGTNPTLESGIMLHPLYGFPYIPASEVKGLLHHIAEMQIMEGIEDAEGNKLVLQTDYQPDLDAEPPNALLRTLSYLKMVKILFGSIHLVQGEMEATNPKTDRKEKRSTGFVPPLIILKKIQAGLKERTKDRHINEKSLSTSWKIVYNSLKWLTDEHTGGILRFYDAVPAPDQNDLLQLDVLTPHYQKYYEDPNGAIYPSDDQSPNPVLFLAVRPEVTFEFFFRSKYDRIAAIQQQNPNDKEAAQIIDILQEWNTTCIEQVKSWLNMALSNFGIGAKTAAGYGYFKSSQAETTVADDQNGKNKKKAPEIPDSKPEPSQPIQAVQPQPFHSNVKPSQKSKNGLTNQYNQEKWNKILLSDYILKIESKNIKVASTEFSPYPEIFKDGSVMRVNYKNGRMQCTVELTLQGIHTEAEAQWVWEEIILPELCK
ncbi:type III-B CRISPR module RAMP protein Cmr6 [bacterium]|nr:type III-B CRISPR module RAMP protein Cmr6 [bacterium]